jgi:hypothetical protein
LNRNAAIDSSNIAGKSANRPTVVSNPQSTFFLKFANGDAAKVGRVIGHPMRG